MLRQRMTALHDTLILSPAVITAAQRVTSHSDDDDDDDETAGILYNVYKMLPVWC